MVPEAPDDIVVLGDGALIAALTRSRGRQMRDIVATIQRHQDEAIRAPSRGVTEITGGPGTGKTVVALHRAAYLLYSERRRFENGGILVVGPSAAYTAYIERVLPSLGEESVALRALGRPRRRDDRHPARHPRGRRDQGVAAHPPAALAAHLAAARPGRRASSGRSSPGTPCGSTSQALRRVRSEVLRNHQHNLAHGCRAHRARRGRVALGAPGRARRVPRRVRRLARRRRVHGVVVAPARPARAAARARRHRPRLRGLARGARPRGGRRRGVLLPRGARGSARWSVSDAALVDDLVGPARRRCRWPSARTSASTTSRSSTSSRSGASSTCGPGSTAGCADEQSQCDVTPADARERLMMGRIDRPSGYAHVLVDEAQDLSPMQWRMLARRGRAASWTVVGDAAQASWSDLAEAGRARDEAFSGQERRGVPHGHQLPQRPRDLRLRARRHPAARARRRHPGCRARDRRRPGRPRRRGVGGVGRGGCRRPAARRGRGLDRGHRARGAGPSGSPGSTAPATGGCRSSTRCRPRAWSGTRRWSSTRRASSRSHRVGCGCSTSC